jgi:Protein of unknown function (DUF1488)
MISGPTHVHCWVSAEALERIESGSAWRQDPMVVFDRHRLRIEQLASQKFEAGEQSPIVMTFDL